MKKMSVEEFYGAKGADLGAIDLLGFKDVIINDDGSVSMTLEAQKKHMNMHGTIQGGIQYIICDTAIGAYLLHIGRPGVGMEGSIHYYRPAREGDLLMSTVRERKNGRRTGNYFVELTNQDGKMIAEAVFSCMYD